MARSKKPSGFNKNSEQSKTNFQRLKDNKIKVPDIIIACEDKVSSPAYFRRIIAKLIEEKIITQDSFVIADHKHSNPLGVLKDLKTHKSTNGKEYKDFDHRWIVIDRDKERVNGGGHLKEDFNNAIKDAKALKVDVAYANDSFELWYLLHFDYKDTAISRDDILKKVIEKLKTKSQHKFVELNDITIKTEKYTNLIFDELLELQKTAIKNAEKLLTSYGTNHNSESDNPSTTVHKLVEVLNSLKKSEG